MTPAEQVHYDKALVEKIPLGKCNLSIRKGYILWNEENRANRLLEYILSVIYQEVKTSISCCTILRLVVVTGNFTSETIEWNRQLDEIWRTSSEGAVGQTLTWGDGQPALTYSVIILSQDIALGLIDDDADIKSIATGTLIHELAHVHDDISYLYCFGPEPIPKQGDWMSHRQFIARSTWGEFFAESRAYPYLKDCYLSENIAFSIILLKDAIQKIKEETLAFQSHQIAGKVWALAESVLSPVFNHFGRSLALLISAQQANENSNQVDQFIKEINYVSLKWEKTIRRLLDVLIKSRQQVEPNIINFLGEIVDQGFRSVRLEPYK